MKARTLAVLAMLLGACAAIPASSVLGEKPGYPMTLTESVPNAPAIGHRIWVPGLDDGYVPQGLTFAGGDLLVSAYRSADPKVDTGPCRVFRIDPPTGNVTGKFDEPTCTHGGGLAYLGDGLAVLIDTRQLFRIDLAKAFATGRAADGARGRVKLAGKLRGSFGSGEGGQLWIGTWTKNAADARLFRLDPQIFDRHDGEILNESSAVESLPIPAEVQGLAFDGKGHAWVSASNGRMGALYRLDRRDGKVLARHEMVPGLEDLEFDARGRLWGLSESGTRKYQAWETKFPYVFEIDTARLQ